MVKKKIDTIDIEDLYDRIVNPSNVEPGAGIVVCAEFQRGNEEEGVWTKKKQGEYIDSLQMNFPTQSLAFVKDPDYSNARYYAEKWKTLDGGNRSRSIRNFIDNKIKNGKGLFFKDHDPGRKGTLERQQERFKAQKLACEFVTIEENDPPNTIAIMFTRLNQTGVKLQPGELIKAHGHKGDVQIIEIAKCIIGDVWKTEDSSEKLLNIRKQWEDALGKLGETKRCNNLALMCALIISAAKSFKQFDTKYDVLKRYFGETLTENDLDNVFEKISCFLDMMKETHFKVTKGMPAKTRIAPIWFAICDGRMTDELYNTMIDFFHCTLSNKALRDEYESILGGKGDYHTTFIKMEKAIRFIQEWGR
tara:strand:+ start:1741 stop:2826 length:1086 start_codon:yes stop_codon:yes gene_type:complete